MGFGGFLGVSASFQAIKWLAFLGVAILILVVLPNRIESSGVRKAENRMMAQQAAYKKEVDAFADKRISEIRAKEKAADIALDKEAQVAYDLYYQFRNEIKADSAAGD